MWIYKSPIGTITIKYIKSINRYGVVYEGTVWETCDTPQSCADDVYMQVTGCSEWDLYDTHDIDIPTDLSEWQKI